MQGHLTDSQLSHVALTILWVALYFGLSRTVLRAAPFHRRVVFHSLAVLATYSVLGFLIEGFPMSFKVFAIAIPLSTAVEKPVIGLFRGGSETRKAASTLAMRDWAAFGVFLAGYLLLFPW